MARQAVHPSSQVLLPAMLALLAWAVRASAAPPDYGQLSLKGDGHAQDHFSLSVQAAARLLGRDLDYDTVYVLSTNAFAPCFDPAENCAAWWATATGRDSCTDLIGRRLGLRFRRLPGPDVKGAPPMPEEEPARDRWLAEYYRKPAVAMIRAAQSQGEVVLTDREWPVRGPHGFYPWCWWGIIVEARDDGTVLGAGLNGFRDNPLEAVGDMLTVGLAEPQIGQAQADFEVLCRAVSRIHGSAAPFLPGERAAYGLAAVDRWIAHMERVPFCEACQDRSQGCAYDTARPTYEGAKVAARFLRACNGSFPAASRTHLDAAAGCYERIAALLGPAMAAQGAEAYQGIIGDLTRQRAHVTQVLRPLRARLRRAADEMTEALVSSLPKAATLRGIPPGKGDGNAFARGLEVLLAQLGTTADYDTLMGDLGLAFITQASDQAPRYGGALDVGWWPLDPSCSPTYLDFAGQSVGRRFDTWNGLATWRPVKGAAGDAISQVRVAHALASGRPVLANHDFWKVVTGYDQAGQPLLGFCPCTGKSDAERLPGPAWAFVTAAEPVPVLDRRQADLEALRHAVALGRDEVTMPGGYVTGQKAYALWAATLRDTEHLGEARWHANMVLHLSINRPSAPVYLAQMATRHPEPVAGHLRAAADLYREVLGRLAVADTSEAAMRSGPGREALARLVEDIAARESRAVAELEAAFRSASRAGGDA
jgi:hypothetical protein